jgi:hypothetical protein
MEAVASPLLVAASTPVGDPLLVGDTEGEVVKLGEAEEEGV